MHHFGPVKISTPKKLKFSGCKKLKKTVPFTKDHPIRYSITYNGLGWYANDRQATQAPGHHMVLTAAATLLPCISPAVATVLLFVGSYGLGPIAAMLCSSGAISKTAAWALIASTGCECPVP